MSERPAVPGRVCGAGAVSHDGQRHRPVVWGHKVQDVFPSRGQGLWVTRDKNCLVLIKNLEEDSQASALQWPPRVLEAGIRRRCPLPALISQEPPACSSVGPAGRLWVA